MILLDDLLLGFARGMYKYRSMAKAAANARLQFVLCLRIWTGLFKGSFRQVLSRFTFEILQTLVGFLAAQFALWLRPVNAIVYFNGVTVLEGAGWGGSVCFGSHILLYPGNKAKIDSPLLLHEFGHAMQSRESGFLYLFKYGIPSLLTPNEAWMEQDANARSESYFKMNDQAMVSWQKSRFSRLKGTIVHPKIWEYVLLFLGIGLVLVPLINLKTGK